jgi:hypothetical protein
VEQKRAHIVFTTTPEESMSSQDYSREPYGGSRGGAGTSDWSAKQPSDTPSAASNLAGQAADLAGQAAEKVKEAASATAETVTSEIKQLLDRQVEGGAQTLGSIASSARRVADDLDRDSPQVAGVVRAFAGRVDGYARDLHDQSFDQLLKSASDFSRQQPALVFGLAAVAGFFALRVLKSGSSGQSPSAQVHNNVHGL